MDLKLENYNSESEINIIEFIFKYEKKKKKNPLHLLPKTSNYINMPRGERARKTIAPLVHPKNND